MEGKSCNHPDIRTEGKEKKRKGESILYPQRALLWVCLTTPGDLWLKSPTYKLEKSGGCSTRPVNILATFNKSCNESFSFTVAKGWDLRWLNNSFVTYVAFFSINEYSGGKKNQLLKSII